MIFQVEPIRPLHSEMVGHEKRDFRLRLVAPDTHVSSVYLDDASTFRPSSRDESLHFGAVAP